MNNQAGGTTAIQEFNERFFNSNQLTASLLEDRFSDDRRLEIQETDGVACFPDGSHMAVCTNCAIRVIEIIGRGEIWGYWSADNPDTVAADCQDGHDFALIDNRFIIDVWLVHVAGRSTQCVFDLLAKRDRTEIVRLFGDTNAWELVERFPCVNSTICVPKL